MKELIDENCELNGNIGVTEMLFDSFKEEMKDLYGHKSEKSSYWKEIPEDVSDDSEVENDESSLTKCENCDFEAKSSNGLKIHITRKHKAKLNHAHSGPRALLESQDVLPSV